MNPHIDLLDPLKCSKCNICSVRCADTHGQSRIKKVDSVPHICIQCEDAPCEQACNVGAIYLQDGIAIVDQDKCVGCKMCIDACPHKSLYVEDLIARKCTLCLDADVLIPACVEACPNKALVINCDEVEGMEKE